MANQRLADALKRSRVSLAELAVYTEKDVKTVGRWLDGRVPHPRTRFQIAKRLKEDEDYLWPGVASTPPTADEVAVLQVYGSRAEIPTNLWDRLIEQATAEIGILVYVGMFLTEKPNLLNQLRRKAAAGTRVRILLGDRDADAVTQRSLDEGIGRRTIAAKIDHATAFFRAIADEPGIEIRAHATVLYNSIYVFDRDMVINPHIYGKTAPHAPALHVKRTAKAGLFEAYHESFDSIWATAKPLPSLDGNAEN